MKIFRHISIPYKKRIQSDSLLNIKHDINLAVILELSWCSLKLTVAIKLYGEDSKFIVNLQEFCQPMTEYLAKSTGVPRFSEILR